MYAAGNLSFRPMKPSDWPEVRSIFIEGMNTGMASLEENPPEWDFWNETHHQMCRIILETGTEMAGWAALSPTSRRKVYAGVAEVSVYISEKHRGKKLGSHLLDELIRQASENGFYMLQAVIFAKNEISIQMHKKAGFRIVGVREKIAKYKNEWQDMVLMERRASF